MSDLQRGDRVKFSAYALEKYPKRDPDRRGIVKSLSKDNKIAYIVWDNLKFIDPHGVIFIEKIDNL